MSIVNTPPIVVVGFNRPVSLKRILSSLSNAYYPNQAVTLIISIDKSPTNKNVLTIAENFEWKFGEKIVKYQSKNLGLRKHIIQCGDLSLEYGSVIILEDDLFVSPNFYFYAQNSLSYCKDKAYIGGVSLYNHLTNVHTRDSFIALEDGFDNYYFQFASSWGQAWTKTQWIEFKEWYDKGPLLSDIPDIPNNVLSWSNKSWLKYFIGFLIVKNRFFLYPKNSLTTNFSDAGTHVSSDSTGFQVPLMTNKKKSYSFGNLDDCLGIYNAYYENIKLLEYLDLKEKDICIDLYGYQKKPNSKYWLTSNVVDYKIIKSFTRSLKPMELNILYNLDGADFFLYDTTIQKTNKYKRDRKRKIDYNIKHLKYNDLVYLFFKETKKKIILLLKKIGFNR